MDKNYIAIRTFFLALCVFGSWLIWKTIPEWHAYFYFVLSIGFGIGILTILLDIALKGFSLRGLTALTFGLAIGGFIAHLLGVSPFFEESDPQFLFLTRLILFAVCMYLGAVVALRGKDEFNLVIPYVKFVPQETDNFHIVVDTSALIDGRIQTLYEYNFMNAALIVPRFIMNELHHIADSTDPQRQARGRKGLDILNKLKRMPHVDLRIHESNVDDKEHVDSKLIFVAKFLKAKLLTLDFNLTKLAEFQGIQTLNINGLSKNLNPEVIIGQTFRVEVIKKGRDIGQGIGYLSDGSMVVVNDGESLIGETVDVEVISILPSAGGKMVFTREANAHHNLLKFNEEQRV